MHWKQWPGRDICMHLIVNSILIGVREWTLVSIIHIFMLQHLIPSLVYRHHARQHRNDFRSCYYWHSFGYHVWHSLEAFPILKYQFVRFSGILLVQCAVYFRSIKPRDTWRMSSIVSWQWYHGVQCWALNTLIFRSPPFCTSKRRTPHLVHRATLLPTASWIFCTHAFC